MAILVVGHKNPDTDTVASAIAVADLFTKRGQEAKAITQGEIAPESAFVLEKFGFAAPEIVTDATIRRSSWSTTPTSPRPSTTWTRASSSPSSTTTSWAT